MTTEATAATLESIQEQLAELNESVRQLASRQIQEERLGRLSERVEENAENLEWSLEQLESIRDLSRDAGPIMNHAFKVLTDQMEELDRKGILDFAKEAWRIIDIILTTYSPEDVRLLADNMVVILNTVKEMTQPEVLHLLNNLTSAYRQSEMETDNLPTSTLGLLWGMRDPRVRRGLAMTMEVLKTIATDRNSTAGVIETESGTDEHN